VVGFGLAAGLFACVTAWAGLADLRTDDELSGPVNLVEALDRMYQAGNEIMVYAGADGTPVALRSPKAVRDRGHETAVRQEAWEIARKVNFSTQPGEINARSLPPTPDQLALLERFALSDAGAVWFRQLADDTIRLFNRGMLAHDAGVWKRLLDGRRPVRLSRLLTGQLTEKGLFAKDTQLFKFYAFPGNGALAEPASIGLGDAGFRCYFPDGGQEVDPHAILSHEFGHTRYGNPASALSIEGEARTVELYENPVRMRNGYEPRRTYYTQSSKPADDSGKGPVEQMFNWESRTKINVDDRQVVKEVHCDCFQPMTPLTLDCELRRLPARQDFYGEPRYESRCTPRLKVLDQMAKPLLDKGLLGSLLR